MLCERVIKSLCEGFEWSLSFRAFKLKILSPHNKQTGSDRCTMQEEQTIQVGFEERSLSFIEENQ